ATAPGGPTVAPGAAPPAAERPPQTSFDVDVYYPKPGDRYEAVSREFYADGRFAAALQAYNRNRQLVPDQPVDVPPVHVLKKQFPQLTGGTVPVGTRAGLPAAGEWQSGAAADPFRASRPRSYTVPAGGTTMRVVARDALGDASRWQEVYDLNPSYAPNQVPEGATLRLPAARGSE
ncbi:MAG: hypothetical protein K2X87_05730, partial [Gemmataceae bacterium]|nr:hypothetical protein [Gemmataceae bacterium]